MDKIKREKLNLTKQQAKDLISGDLEGFTVIKDEIVEKARWSILYDIVVKRESDGKFFADSYRVGATESQDEQPYEYEEPNFTEVFPVEKKITVYE